MVKWWTINKTYQLKNNIFPASFRCAIHLCRSSSTQIDARDVKLAMGGQYNFIPIFYFFDIQAPISIRNFSGNKIFFKISPQEWKESREGAETRFVSIPSLSCWSESHSYTQRTRGLVNFCVMCCVASLSKNDDFHFSQVPPLAPPALTGVAVKLAKFRGGVILRNTGTAGETKAGTLVNLNFITWMYVNIFSPNCIFLSEVSRAFMEPIKRNNNPH